MDWWHLIDTSKVFVYMLVLTRVSGLVIMSPVMMTTDTPMQVRALLAFAFSLIVMPVEWYTEVIEPDTLPALAIMIAAELGIGLALGLGLYILFVGISLAGELIGQMGGLSASQIFDPISGDQTPLLSRAYQYLAITVFALIGGLDRLVESLLDTFQTIPIGTIGFHPEVAHALITVLSISFSMAIRVAAPVVVAVLITMLVMGLLGKTLPQLNLMSVGFGINSMVMFAVFCFSLGTGMWCFQERIADIFEIMMQGIHGISPHGG
ncbi:MAG: flagellar biosynthetic protein FliR [Planctomycetaceae bacterium]|jgi:flagellar biosynthetic protein FliR|nr:flagellar biosynthetic protein FliR [Planctomycetaceae bacterium]